MHFILYCCYVGYIVKKNKFQKLFYVKIYKYLIKITHSPYVTLILYSRYNMSIIITKVKLQFKILSISFQMSHLQYLPTVTVLILSLLLTSNTWSFTIISLTNVFCSS